MVTLTITSTLAGASKVRLGPWVSRVQAEHMCTFLPGRLFPCIIFLHPQGRHTITPKHSGRSLLLLLPLPFFLHFKNLGSIGQIGVLRDV